jgi:hypothetical protein
MSGGQGRSPQRLNLNVSGSGSFFWYRHLSRIAFHVSGATFHRTVLRHASRPFGTHSLAHARGAARTSFVHSFRAAGTAVHSGVAILHHHLLPAFGLTVTNVMFHLANSACNKANEKDESHHDKEPGYHGKEFAGIVFSEFCKQQGACKNSK